MRNKINFFLIIIFILIIGIIIINLKKKKRVKKKIKEEEEEKFNKKKNITNNLNKKKIEKTIPLLSKKELSIIKKKNIYGLFPFVIKSGETLSESWLGKNILKVAKLKKDLIISEYYQKKKENGNIIILNYTCYFYYFDEIKEIHITKVYEYSEVIKDEKGNLKNIRYGRSIGENIDKIDFEGIEKLKKDYYNNKKNNF